MLASEKGAARAAYAMFVHDGLGEGQRGEFHRGTGEGRILGDESFADEILAKVQQQEARAYSLDEVINAVCAQFRLEASTLRQAGKVRPMTEARALAAAVVQASPHLRLTDLAKLVGRDVSALGKAAQRLSSDGQGHAAIADMVARLQFAKNI
jgi:chromosomal replication initiation ATPase DnaA